MVLDNGGGVMCLTCGKTLSTLSIGNRHVRESHRPTQKAICRICQRIYKNGRVLNEHYKTTHGVSAKQMRNVIKVPDSDTSFACDQVMEEQYLE